MRALRGFDEDVRGEAKRTSRCNRLTRSREAAVPFSFFFLSLNFFFVFFLLYSLPFLRTRDKR